MSYSLVKFVEDGLYHVCPSSKVRPDLTEPGIVTARYKGMSFRAVLYCQGDKEKMRELRDRCILNDNLTRKYKIISPSKPTATVTCSSQETESLKSTTEEFYSSEVDATTKQSSTVTCSSTAHSVDDKPPDLEVDPSKSASVSQFIEAEKVSTLMSQSATFLKTSHIDEDETHVSRPHKRKLFELFNDSSPEESYYKLSPDYEPFQPKSPTKKQATLDLKNKEFSNNQTVSVKLRPITSNKTSLFSTGDVKKFKTLADKLTLRQSTNFEERSGIGHVEDEMEPSGIEVVENVLQQPKLENPNKKKETKKYFCPFCKGLFSKFARHVLQVHGSVEEVQEIKDLPPKSPSRKIIIDRLRARGARMFNSQQQEVTKLIIPRQILPLNRDKYTQCHLCGNLYKSEFLCRHVRKCPNSEGTDGGALRKARKLEHTATQEESEDAIILFRDILPGMRDPVIKRHIQDDPLLISFGHYLCKKYGPNIHLVNLIRKKLRHCVLVLDKIKTLTNDINKMEDIYQPKFKEILFEAIKKLTGFSKGIFQKAAMANELSTLLHECSERVTLKALESNDEDKINQVHRWSMAVKMDYNALIGKQARHTLETKKWNRPSTLPLAEDILKLNKRVKELLVQSLQNLKQEFNFPDWYILNKTIMVKILIFNRKRVGDVHKMTIQNFNKRHNVQKGSISYKLLSQSERVISGQYMRLVAQGKKAGGMPMLLDKDTISHVKFLLTLRNAANVPPTNMYIFAKKDDQPFSAAEALNEFAYDCGAAAPNLLTGTKLRKHIATATQAFNFTQNELSILANFLGHNLLTHSEFYRLPDETLHLAKISVLLQMIDDGRELELKGKTLQELNTLLDNIVQSDAHVEEEDGGSDEETRQQGPLLSTPTKNPKFIRKTWSTPEKQIMRRVFKRHLTKDTLPTPMECDDVRKKYSPLKLRQPKVIKAWVFNENNRVHRKGRTKKSFK